MHLARNLSAQDLQIVHDPLAHLIRMMVGMADSPTTTNPTSVPPGPPPSPEALLGPPTGPALPPPTGPALPPPGAAPTPRAPLPSGWATAAIGVGVVAAAVLGRVPVSSVGAALFVAALALALHLTGVVTGRAGRFSLAAAVFFGVLLVVRTDPRLVAFNAMAAALFLLVAVIEPRRMLDWRPLQLLGDAVSVVFQPFLMLGDLLPVPSDETLPKPDRSSRRQLVIGIVQGLAIAAPLVIILVALLGSADAVFADWIARGQFDAGEFWAAAFRFSLGAGLILTLIGRTLRPSTTVPDAGVSLGRTPTLVVLASLNAVFTLFVAAQLYALTGAGDRILSDAGLTYRDYARQGFFQLLWVSALTLLVLMSLRALAEQWYRADRWFRWSSLATVMLTIGVVVVAFGRLQLYIADDGLTPLRFYSSVFSVWVAIGFVVVAIRLIGWRPHQSWTLPAVVASGVVVLVALNVANPEARIADNLVAREDADVVIHMQKLTGDGQLVMANGLDEIDPGWADDVEAQLCASVPESDSWLSWNLGRSRARSALLELC